TYYLRAGAINWNGVVNYAVALTTRTDSGGAPGTPSFVAVYISSLSVTYGTVTNGQGYELDASTSGADFYPVAASTVTTDNSRNSLSFNFGTLNPDTTYFVRIGALYNGATTYNATQPSTSTLTNVISPSVLSVSSQTVRVGWTAFAVGSGTNTA